MPSFSFQGSDGSGTAPRQGMEPSQPGWILSGTDNRSGDRAPTQGRVSSQGLDAGWAVSGAIAAPRQPGIQCRVESCDELDRSR